MLEVSEPTKNLFVSAIVDETNTYTIGTSNVTQSGANMDESGEKLDLEECVDEFVAMYAASNSTTDTALLWGLGELTRNPAVMVKLVAEVTSNYLCLLIKSQLENFSPGRKLFYFSD